MENYRKIINTWKYLSMLVIVTYVALKNPLAMQIVTDVFNAKLFENFGTNCYNCSYCKFEVTRI